MQRYVLHVALRLKVEEAASVGGAAAAADLKSQAWLWDSTLSLVEARWGGAQGCVWGVDVDVDENACACCVCPWRGVICV